ncbi:MAG TPA: hypothetical protein VFI31_02380 [Pirellulales bacterium]|nr:hypothetical protein [Pirellulales bacterium]
MTPRPCIIGLDAPEVSALKAKLAEDGLQAAGVGKRGIYRWGRKLGVREPWLPGDILPVERVNVRLPSTTRIFNHHTAVIDEVNRDFIVVLHQNSLPAHAVYVTAAPSRRCAGERFAARR